MADKLGLGIGCPVNPGGTAYPQYRDQLLAIQKREFNLGSEWLSWAGIEPERGVRNFGWLDYQLAEADLKGLRTFGYNLINPVYGHGLPRWVQDISSRADLVNLLTSVVTNTLKHAKGRIYAWNIVCETQHPQGDIFQSIIGPEYVEIAFAAARKADPGVLLCYADYANSANTITNPRYVLTKTIVDKLRASNLIDLVGIENPGGSATSPLGYDTIVTGFQSYGLPVIVTEFSVWLHSLPGTQQSKFAKQADIYSTVLQAAIDSGVCNGFLLESIGDKLSSWETGAAVLPNVFPDNDPTPYDDDFQPKPAYYAMSSVLRKAVDAKFKYRARLPMLALDR